MTKMLVIGAGHVGGAAVTALEAAGLEVILASRSAAQVVDVTDPASIQALYERVGTVDAVVMAVGSVPFKPLADLSRGDFESGYFGKVQPQVDVVTLGTPFVVDGGSFTLTTGIVSREPIRTGVAAALANGAVDAFVKAAAQELPRGIRINAVSPTVLVEATGYHPFFPGFPQVTAAAVGQGYVKAVLGAATGQVIILDGP